MAGATTDEAFLWQAKDLSVSIFGGEAVKAYLIGGIVTAIVLTSPSAAQELVDAGKYSGTYVCRQGATPVTLEVDVNGRGRFAFGGADSPAGAFTVQLRAQSRGGVLMQPIAWERQPRDYSMVAATLRQNGDRLAGQVLSPGCTSIDLVRETIKTRPQPAAQVGGASRTRMHHGGTEVDLSGSPEQVVRSINDMGYESADEKAKLFQEFIAKDPDHKAAQLARSSLPQWYRRENRHAEAAEAAFDAYKHASTLDEARGPLDDFINALMELRKDKAVCAAMDEYADVAPRDPIFDHQNKRRIANCSSYVKGSAAEGANPRGVTARYDPATFTFIRSSGSAFASDPKFVRSRSDTELARLPRPSDQRPVFAEIASKSRRLIYSFRDCEGRKVDAQLGLQRSGRYEFFSRIGDLCGDRPYYFGAIEVDYDELTRELMAGRLQDGYGKPVRAPTGVERIVFASFADYERYAELAKTSQTATGPAGSPSASDIAKAYADSFVRQQDPSGALRKMGVVALPSAYSGGYQVIVSADGSMKLLAGAPEGIGKLWEERHRFFIDSERPPVCKAAGSAYTCTVRLSLQLAVESLGSNAVRAILTGRSETAYDKEQRARREATRADFSWEPRTLSLTKVPDGWRSSQVDAEMKRLVTVVEAGRSAAGRSGNSGKTTAGEKCRASAMRYYDSGDMTAAAAASVACPM